MVVHNIEDPEPAMVGKLVAHEVERPALHRPLRNLSCDTVAPGELTALLRAHLKPFGAIQPLRAFVVHDQPLPP